VPLISSSAHEKLDSGGLGLAKANIKAPRRLAVLWRTAIAETG
jgi:hypothetical protein